MIEIRDIEEYDYGDYDLVGCRKDWKSGLTVMTQSILNGPNYHTAKECLKGLQLLDKFVFLSFFLI